MSPHAPDPAVLEAGKKMAAERRKLRQGILAESLREDAARARADAAEGRQMMERLASAAGIDLAEHVASRQRDVEDGRARFNEWRRTATAQRGAFQAAAPTASQLVHHGVFPTLASGQDFSIVTLDTAQFIGPAADGTFDDAGVYRRTIVKPEIPVPMRNVARVFTETTEHPTVDFEFVVLGPGPGIDFGFMYTAHNDVRVNALAFVYPNGVFAEFTSWLLFLPTYASVKLTVGIDLYVFDRHGKLVLARAGTRDPGLDRSITGGPFQGAQQDSGLYNYLSEVYALGVLGTVGTQIYINVWVDLETDALYNGSAALDFLSGDFEISVPAVYLFVTTSGRLG